MDNGSKELYISNKKLAVPKFLGVEPSGRKEDLPDRLSLPAEAISAVNVFMDYKPYGEMQGACRFNPISNEFKFDPQSRIEGQTLDPNRRMSKVKGVQGLMIKESLRRLMLADYDIEFHTHPDFDDTNYSLELNGIKVPKSYWETWSSFPSDSDLYGYVAMGGSLIDFMVSNSSKAATLLVPNGTSLRSRSFFYLGSRLHPTYKRIVYPILENMVGFVKRNSSDPKALHDYFTNEFKLGMRRAITMIGDKFNFTPYFADNFEGEFVKL